MAEQFFCRFVHFFEKMNLKQVHCVQRLHSIQLEQRGTNLQFNHSCNKVVFQVMFRQKTSDIRETFANGFDR